MTPTSLGSIPASSAAAGPGVRRAYTSPSRVCSANPLLADDGGADDGELGDRDDPREKSGRSGCGASSPKPARCSERVEAALLMAGASW